MQTEICQEWKVKIANLWWTVYVIVFKRSWLFVEEIRSSIVLPKSTPTPILSAIRVSFQFLIFWINSYRTSDSLVFYIYDLSTASQFIIYVILKLKYLRIFLLPRYDISYDVMPLIVNKQPPFHCVDSASKRLVYKSSFTKLTAFGSAKSKLLSSELKEERVNHGRNLKNSWTITIRI